MGVSSELTSVEERPEFTEEELDFMDKKAAKFSLECDLGDFSRAQLFLEKYSRRGHPIKKFTDLLEDQDWICADLYNLSTEHLKFAQEVKKERLRLSRINFAAQRISIAPIIVFFWLSWDELKTVYATLKAKIAAGKHWLIPVLSQIKT